MADEETFDIDIYGDGQDGFAAKPEPQDNHMSGQQTPVEPQAQDVKTEDWKSGSATPQVAADSNNAPHGVKRKSSTMDDRPVDPNSTQAVQITELHWWITEDDLRGWCVGAGCEPEIKDLTFNEHKVNGKSKGYVFVSRLLLGSQSTGRSILNSHLKRPHQHSKTTLTTSRRGNQNQKRPSYLTITVTTTPTKHFRKTTKDDVTLEAAATTIPTKTSTPTTTSTREATSAAEETTAAETAAVR
jgi:hypothetical protein